MKTLIFGILLLTTLGACKKDYNCSCDYYAEEAYQTTEVTKITATKYKAKKECKEMNNDVSLSYGGNVYHAERKCSLK